MKELKRLNKGLNEVTTTSNRAEDIDFQTDDRFECLRLLAKMKEVPILKDLKTYINRYRKDRVVELGIGKYVCRVIWVEYPRKFGRFSVYDKSDKKFKNELWMKFDVYMGDPDKAFDTLVQSFIEDFYNTSGTIEFYNFTTGKMQKIELVRTAKTVSKEKYTTGRMNKYDTD